MNERARCDYSEWQPGAALGPGYPPAPSARSRAVAIGNFDGAHRGHAAVAAAARAAAGPGPAEILALTFEPHPRRFFQPDRPFFRLTQPELRAESLAGIGFDGAVILPFGRALADLSAGDFVREILVARLGAAAVAVGEDFHFGKGRAGTPDFLVAEGARHGFRVALVPPLRDAEGGVISSSAIRAALAAGDLARANRLIGHAYTIEGAVIHGAKRGRDLGYPTANIALDPGCGLAHGIYAVRASGPGRRFDGVASFGRRPQFDNGAPLLEVHLLDFAGDLYGQRLRVAFHAYLRAEARFESLEALIAQMDQDRDAARRLLAMPGADASRSGEALL
jgi:riboflavin kinase/FMN adenylyltransferase